MRTPRRNCQYCKGTGKTVERYPGDPYTNMWCTACYPGRENELRKIQAVVEDPSLAIPMDKVELVGDLGYLLAVIEEQRAYYNDRPVYHKGGK